MKGHEMNGYAVKRLAEVLVIQAEIEGMKFANIEREALGLSLAYDESSFAQAADNLRRIATKLDDQINR